jgi:hypothetical protein
LYLLKDLCIDHSSPVIIYCDNQSALHIADLQQTLCSTKGPSILKLIVTLLGTKSKMALYICYLSPPKTR